MKCDRCGLVLSPHDLVMRTMSYIYHLGCFQCVICAQPLQVNIFGRSSANKKVNVMKTPKILF